MWRCGLQQIRITWIEGGCGDGFVEVEKGVDGGNDEFGSLVPECQVLLGSEVLEGCLVEWFQ